MEVVRNLPSTVLLGTGGVVEVVSNLSSTVLLGTLSLHEMLKIILRRRTGKESISPLFRVERRVQKSLSRITYPVRRPCNLDLDVLGKLTVCPDYLCKPGDSGGGFSNAPVRLGLKGEVVRQC